MSDNKEEKDSIDKQNKGSKKKIVIEPDEYEYQGSSSHVKKTAKNTNEDNFKGKSSEGSVDSSKVEKDLRKIVENFGQGLSEPAFHRNMSDTSICIEKVTYTHSQNMEKICSEDPGTQENNKCTTTEESTLDGKFIEIRDESVLSIEHCHGQCTGHQHNEQSMMTDLDSTPLIFENDAPHFCNERYKQETTKCKEDLLSSETIVDCPCEKGHEGYVNRYNNSQVRIVQKKVRRSMMDRWFQKRRYAENVAIGCEHQMRKESGETIPQLYKANVKHVGGPTPERFTFKAVTGAQPVQMECKHRDNFSKYDIHPPMCTQHEEEYNNYDNGQNFKHQHHKRAPLKGIALRHARSNNEGRKYKKRFQRTSEKNNKNPISKDLQACLNFDGIEYLSTKPLPERIDIYCFDHLNTSYFRTSDQPPPLITDVAMERTEAFATRFWAEMFGFIHIFIAFVIAFILQFYKFVLYSIVRPLMIGLVQLTSDYFFKPLLTIIYNGFTQPFLVFLFNVAASFRDLCMPIARGIGYFVSEVAVILRSIRLVEWGKPMVHLPAVKDSYC